MKQKTLDFYVDEQFIRAPHHRVVADSRGFLWARFSFGEAWQGLTKTAVFLGADGRAYHMLLTDDACEVPPQVLHPTQFFVSVFGGDRLTTDRVAVEVAASGLVEGITPPPTTPDIYSQLTAAVAEQREAAAAAAAAAAEKAQEAQEAVIKANTAAVTAAVSEDSAASYARAATFFSEQSSDSADEAKAAVAEAKTAAAAASEDAAAAVNSAAAAEQSKQAAAQGGQMAEYYAYTAQQSAAVAADSATAAAQSAAAAAATAAMLTEDFVLIEECTLTEDTTFISRQNTPSGEAYHYKKLLVHFTLPADNTGNAYVYFNPIAAPVEQNTLAYMLLNSSSGALYLEANRAFFYSMGFTGLGEYTSYVKCGKIADNADGYVIDNLRISANGTFKAGTDFKIYGVRAA